MEFRITWKVELNADDFIDAARSAYGMMIDPFSEATYFDVKRMKDGEIQGIDLHDPFKPEETRVVYINGERVKEE